jgi:serine/threonine protein kinase
VTSDVYSLGATLHYLLIGKPPFAGASGMMQMFAHRESPVPSLRTGRPDVPLGIDLVFQRMLAKKKADRYPSMAELIGELNREYPAGV